MLGRIILLLPAVCASGAMGQEPEATPTAEFGPALEAPWGAIDAQWSERRYKVEAIRFKARDESGIDWLGSDEVMVETVDAKGFTVTDEIGNINSGDTHEFVPEASCIIGVHPGSVVLGETAACDVAGEPGPFSFQVTLWEKDGFSLGDLFGNEFGTCFVPPPPPGLHSGPHCANDGEGDDFLGRAELFFPLPDLEATLPNVGDSFTEAVVLSPCEHGPCAGWLLPDYSFTYRTTRLPDVDTDFRSELLAAMSRSQIGLADDAIAAGLRLLTELPPRPAEKEVETTATTAGQ